MAARYEPVEIAAGRWQLRPWPAAHADLADLVGALPPVGADPVRARVDGWDDGSWLGWAVREATTGRALAEVAVVPDRGDGPRLVVTVVAADGAAGADAGAAAASRWAGAVGIRVVHPS